MKRSYTYKQYAKEELISGVIFMLIGFLWLMATVIISIVGIEIKVGWVLAAAPSLIFFCASAWSLLVEYRFDKYIQQGIEREEAQEEQERQRQLTTANQK